MSRTPRSSACGGSATLLCPAQDFGPSPGSAPPPVVAGPASSSKRCQTAGSTAEELVTVPTSRVAASRRTADRERDVPRQRKSNRRSRLQRRIHVSTLAVSDLERALEFDRALGLETSRSYRLVGFPRLRV